MSDAARSVLDGLHVALLSQRAAWPSVVSVPDACVARVTSPDGHKRTAVVVVLRRGRVERAIVVDTEAP